MACGTRILPKAAVCSRDNQYVRGLPARRSARSLYMQLMDVLDFDSTMLRTLHAYAENVPNGTRARRLQRLAELGQARHRD